MIAYLAGYVATMIVFIVADMTWLGSMVNRIYRPALGDILLDGVNLPPAIVFYFVYPVGIMIFAVLPALPSGSSGAPPLRMGRCSGSSPTRPTISAIMPRCENWTLVVDRR